jgi:hypothetical protein
MEMNPVTGSSERAEISEYEMFLAFNTCFNLGTYAVDQGALGK